MMTNSLEGLIPDNKELPFINDASEQEEPPIDWSKVDLDSIGGNFEVLEEAKKETGPTRLSSRLSKFVIGSSPHLFFVLEPKIPKYVIKKTDPINANTKVTNAEKTAWANALGKNMRNLSLFLERDLLPLTSALHSATLSSQERYAQLIDDPGIKLPLGFILKKGNLAAQLKIIDKISDFMGLSAENRRLMKAEFRPSRNDPTPPSPNPGQNNERPIR